VKIALLKFVVYIVAVSTSAVWSDYQIVWSTIDGGGGQSSGGQYVLTGTIGQPDAAYFEGGHYEVLGGFWPGGPQCFVDLKQFAAFAQHWLETGCDSGNGWCSGADLNHLNGVDYADLEIFVQQWLFSCPYRWPLK
jgi:hypothetical protein